MIIEPEGGPEKDLEAKTREKQYVRMKNAISYAGVSKNHFPMLPVMK